jgi:hypothetical protein
VRTGRRRGATRRHPPSSLGVYSWCADAAIPELTTVAETIETWWPAVLVFLQTD